MVGFAPMSKGPRYFTYDAFLSHNQNDGSKALADRLTARGVTVWHDGDRDMSDTCVQQEVQRALASSRFTCVCVGPAFRDSKWVRAEYLSGLEVETQFGADRVLVVALAPNPAIPGALRHKPCFSAQADFDYLAAHLQAANARGSIGAAEALIAPSIAARLREDARRLRSLSNHHTEVLVEQEEEMKLAQERFERAVSDDADDANLIGELWFALAHDKAPMGYWAMAALASADRENRARATPIAPDSPGYDYLVASVERRIERSLHFYETLAHRPSLCRLIAAQVNARRYRPDLDRDAYPKPRPPPRDDLLDPLGVFIAEPPYRARAQKLYEAILVAVADAIDAKEVAIYRQFAREAAANGYEAEQALRRRFAKVRGLKRWWRVWGDG